MIPATWGDDGWPVFGDNNQVSASDTYDKLIDLPADLENHKVLGGLGIAIISTNKGLLTDKEARKQNVGGEVLAFVW